MPSNGDDDDDDDDDEDSNEESEEEDIGGDNSSDDDDDDDDSDEDSKNKSNDTEKRAADMLLKETNVLKDIGLIQDIFAYVDRTSKRIIQSLALQEEIRKLQDENKRVTDLLKVSKDQHQPQSRAEKYSDDEDVEADDNDSVSWSQYEELNDGQRAQLLERSLQLLNNDANRREHSDERKRDQHGKERRSRDRKQGGR